MSASIDPRTLAALTERERRRFEESNAGSGRLAARGRGSLAGGVASDFQRAEPWPLHLGRGSGARLVDADGNERIDFHNGFGAVLHGHGNGAIAAAVAERYAAGSQLGAPAEDAIAVAEELASRWGLPLWRFTGSGTEAAADAIRVARAATGRRVVVRAAGGFHGVGVAAGGEAEEVPFNDAAALRRRLAELAAAGRPAACVILEPALMQGCVMPEDGYLDAVREATEEAGTLLILDEAKTGLAAGPGGVTRRLGVRPDLVVLAKALGGGLPAAALGGGEEAMAAVGPGGAAQAGTFNGNPLAMVAARVCLTEVLTPAAHERMERRSARLAEALAAAFVAAGLPVSPTSLGARGAVALGAAPARDAAELAAAREPRLERLLWLFAANRGIYLTPARPLGWTLSVAHEEADVDAHAAVVAELLAEL